MPEKQKSEPLVVGRRARSIVAAAALPSVAATTAEQEAEDLKKLGVRLRNLLKLPKAHKWVCYEWFYSNLDQYVFVPFILYLAWGKRNGCSCVFRRFPYNL